LCVLRQKRKERDRQKRRQKVKREGRGDRTLVCRKRLEGSSELREQVLRRWRRTPSGRKELEAVKLEVT
jgi:hypothetical protein